MSTLRTVTFSKDRPAQLFLMLESVEKHLPDTALLNTVIYKASSPDYQSGYDKVIRHFDCVEFLPEENIYGQTLDVFLDSACEYGGFLCDDQIFTKTSEPIKDMMEIEDSLGNSLCCFAPRLGFNTRMADYFTNTFQPPLTRFQSLENRLLVWNWGDYSPASDYGYPLSVSFHIYRMHLLQSMLTQLPVWDNPNTLEGVWQTLMQQAPPFIGSYTQSTVFNNPVNRVSDKSGCPHANDDQKAMNDTFLSGKTLDLSYYEGVEIRGCHEYHGVHWR